MLANLTEHSKLEQRLLSNFYWLRIADHVKFIKECVMRTKNHVFVWFGLVLWHIRHFRSLMPNPFLYI